MSDGVAFGNYRLLRRLARGGMAEVFLARQQGVEGFERRVAIKRILPHLSDSAEFRTMFLDEARLAAQLSHPNIIHIYDFGKVEDYYFIAMEYVDGVDLGRLIKQARTTQVPFELIARVMADICAGLHYAHNVNDSQGKRLNVVHRDVTPQNVLVTYDGIVKVVDFGIAKATWQANRTRPGVVKGKYAYMSPEQVEGRSLDARSDVFSTGICLYELMTGMPLYRRDNVTEAMKEIRDGKPIHPEQHREGIPHELMSVLKRSLETSRDARYASAAAMQLDLERYLKNATGLATPQLIGEFLRREAPKLSEGELLVEAKPGNKEMDEPPAPQPEPPRAATGMIAKGGTAQISSMRQAVTPAYDNIPVAASSSPSTPVEPKSSASAKISAQNLPKQIEDPTAPGKGRGSSSGPSADAAEPPAEEQPVDKGLFSSGPRFFTDGDEDATRRDDRAPQRSEEPTTRSPKITPPAGERQLSTGERRAQKSNQERATRSSQSERIQRSGPFPGSPLGSDVSQPAGVLSTDPTAMLANPPDRSLQHASRGKPGRSYALLVGLLLVLVAATGYAVRRLIVPAKPTKIVVTQPDLAPVAIVPEATADLGTEADPTNPKVVTTALPVQTSATIGIYTRPSGAKVFIDGQPLDMLTPVRTLPVTAGPHHVVIERTGSEPREVDVSLRAGEHHVLDYELPEEKSLQQGASVGKKKGSSTTSHGNGSLTVQTTPWSRAFEGSRLLGETPLVNVPLGEGSHTITFVNPDLPPVKKRVVVRVGEETKLKFALDGN